MEANNFSQSNVLEFASKPSQTVWSVAYDILAVFYIEWEQFWRMVRDILLVYGNCQSSGRQDNFLYFINLKI